MNPHGRPFDPDMPEEALHLLAGGVPVMEALARVGWNPAAAYRWALRHQDHTLLRHLRPVIAAHKRERQSA